MCDTKIPNDKSVGSFVTVDDAPAEPMELSLQGTATATSADQSDVEGGQPAVSAAAAGRRLRGRGLEQSRSMFGQFLADRLAEEVDELEAFKSRRLERARRQRHSLVDQLIRSLNLQSKDGGGSEGSGVADEVQNHRRHPFPQSVSFQKLKEELRDFSTLSFLSTPAIGVGSVLAANEENKSTGNPETTNCLNNVGEMIRLQFMKLCINDMDYFIRRMTRLLTNE
jgi:hypothetical protein